MAASEIPEPSQAPEPSRSGARDALIVGLAGAALVAGLIWWVASAGHGPPPLPSTGPLSKPQAHPLLSQFVGDRACRECHPGETAAHSGSGHSRTLRPATAARDLVRWLDGREVPDPEYAGVTWRYSARGGNLTTERIEGGKHRTIPLDFAFGSGHHATTFVSVFGTEPGRRKFLENRLTYFTRTRSLGITPGQHSDAPEGHVTPEGSELPEAEGQKCFVCHATLTSARDPRELDLATMVPNINCERCHGPAREHVQVASRGMDPPPMPSGPGTWTADSQMLLCGDCHRHPTQLEPGVLRAENPEIVRFQPVGLMQSACYRKSQGALSCVTCHDPHSRASTDRQAYEAVCLSCHEGAGHTVCPVSARGDCLDCHMPKRDAGQTIFFTDHWIRIRPGQAGSTRKP